MDHSVKAMNSHRKIVLARLLNRHRFENDELEALYQRYIFKLQHSSIASVVALFILLTAILANLSFAYVQAPTPQNIYHTVHCILFILLLVFLNTRFMQDAYLLWVCYVILFFCATFCAVALPMGGTEGSSASFRVETRRVIVEGAWQIVFVIFISYAMMPLKTWISAAFGFLLPIAHVIVTVIYAKEYPYLKWQQVSTTSFCAIYIFHVFIIYVE